MMILPGVVQQQTNFSGIDFVASSQDQQSNDTDPLVLSMPAGALTDDLALVFCSAQGGTNTTSTDMEPSGAGWVQDVRSVGSTGNTTRTTYIHYKVLTSDSESDVSIPCSTGFYRSASLHVFRGVDTTTPIDATSTFAEASNTELATNAAITPTSSGCCLVLCWYPSNNDITAVDAGGVPAVPSGMVMGETRITLSQRQLLVCYKTLVDTGTSTITPSQWRVTTNNSNVSDYNAHTIVLRPA